MEEEVLVRQMKNGDKSSFDLLYDKYKNIALKTAYLITGNLPDDEAAHGKGETKENAFGKCRQRRQHVSTERK